ncbi:MAG: polyketide cyclase [Actinomycetia bacterium]|nr:polyketide cyclase [Actinomycetes bacterium]
MPTTDPAAPTIGATVRATMPVPQARSRTRSPPRGAATSTTLVDSARRTAGTSTRSYISGGVGLSDSMVTRSSLFLRETVHRGGCVTSDASVTRAVDVQVSSEVDRPVADVWRFYAVEHVRNHPRWDPDMHLEQLSDGPIGLGTRIRRLNTRWGAPVEGEMEVVEFDPERAFAVSIHDPNMDAQGRVTFEARGAARTLVTVTTGIEGMDEPEKIEFLTRMMQRSVDNLKRLIETEMDSEDA